MINMVCGFYFSGDEVLLVHKEHGPDAVVGKWNGVGGKIEKGEDWQDAMWREFEEETGIGETEKWQKFCVLRGGDWQVVFYSYMNGQKWASMPDENDAGEKLSWFSIRDLPEVVPNLWWLIPMAVEVYRTGREFYYIEETY